MKKKALALAVAGAFFAPASYAAQDNQGMHYTSAAEGFYASLRAVFHTEKSKNGGAGISNSGSRFGVRGSNDLGNGLKGFYQYEANLEIDSAGFSDVSDDDGRGVSEGGHLNTRIAQVGLEGAFGRVWVGSGWTEGYNMVYSATDVANNGSGNFAQYSGGNIGVRMGRANRMIQYRTPDINGFQGALGVNMYPGVDNFGTGTGDTTDVDQWSFAAKYSVQGFTGAFAYSVRPDTNLKYDHDAIASNDNLDSTNQEDHSGWAARLGYAQDNWYVNGWYGRENNGDFKYAVNNNAIASPDDAKYVSIAGGVTVDKVNMYAVWEKEDNGRSIKPESAYTIIGVSYNLGSRSKVWMDYVGQDVESNADKEDYINVGLRHDF